MSNDKKAKLALILVTLTIIFSLPTLFVSNSMYTLDLYNNVLYVGNIAKIYVGNVTGICSYYLPQAILYDPQNGYIYVAVAGPHYEDFIFIINGSTNRMVGAINIGKYNSPRSLAYDPQNGDIYVGTISGITVINGKTNAVTKNISCLYVLSPYGSMVYDPQNGYIYVGSLVSIWPSHTSYIIVINGSTNKVITNISVEAQPDAMVYDPQNNYIYAADYVINASSNKVVGTIQVYPNGMVYDPQNGYIYVANLGSGAVFVINGKTNAVITIIKVGNFPDAITYDPQNGLIYVANAASNTVSVINTSSNEVINTISVGCWPDAITYDPQNGDIYVANLYSGSVSIISTKATSIPLSTSFAIIGTVAVIIVAVVILLRTRYTLKPSNSLSGKDVFIVKHNKIIKNQFRLK